MDRKVLRRGGWACALLVASALPFAAACGSTLPEGEENVGEESEELIVGCPAGYGAPIVGTAAGETINGTPGNDCILANGGNDIINGLGGDDFIAGGAGDDTINGGDGNDTLRGETGNDTINGDIGVDLIYGEDGNDTLNGGDGDDTIIGGAGQDIIHGDLGNDTIAGQNDPDQIFGDGGNDNLSGNDGNDAISGGDGADYVLGGNGVDTIHGDAGDDTLRGEAGADQIFGDAGADTIFGGTENDTISGGTENDILRGEDGNDVVSGNDGDDTIYGGNNDDTLSGNNGNDKLFGEAGNDIINGNDGDDRLVGGGGTDTLNGGNGNDLEKGGAMFGNANNDVLVQGTSDDGGADTDACSGGPGSNNCEIAEPPSFCSANNQCAPLQRCATEVGVCIYCQSDSECTTGTCVPTKGCTTTELVCNDTTDNDGDSLVDCADPDCANDAACVLDFGGGGGWHDCVPDASGQVKCWGRNNLCQIGPTAQGTTPGVVTGVVAASQVRCGSFHSCAIDAGVVKCWGATSSGAIGDGGSVTTDCTTTPVSVATTGTVKSVAAGGIHTCAVMTSGSVQCWGDNKYGQLGDGSTALSSKTPVNVTGITNAVQIAAGNVNSCALLADTTVKCWGRNNAGQLGTGASGVTSNVPVTIVGISGAAEVSVGQGFACARLTNGTVKCWGTNGSGELGNGTQTSSATPVLVTGLTAASQISSGPNHTCIVRSTGAVRCWGQNTDGQMGIGTTSAAQTIASALVPAINDANGLSVGRGFTCVRHKDPVTSVTCFGDNQYGEIAADLPTDHPTGFTKVGLP
jgi:alpha-tubulin suppressor-like RCC1 family protein